MQKGNLEKNKIILWLEAIRIRTLPASLIPILISYSLFDVHNDLQRSDKTAVYIYLLCALFALLIQLCTNFANEYYDYLKGADTEHRLGPSRNVSLGLIKPESMRNASFITATLAFISGCFLLKYGGLMMLPIGILSIILAFAYTGGPFPLAYNALGDIFVILFFGLIAVITPFYIATGEINIPVFIFGMGAGLVTNNLLVVNNYRDVQEDRSTGKNTLVVLFGRKCASIQYLISYTVSFIAVPAIYFFLFGFYRIWLISILIIPSLFLYKRLICCSDKRSFDQVLKFTAALLVSYGALSSIVLFSF